VVQYAVVTYFFSYHSLWDSYLGLPLRNSFISLAVNLSLSA